MFSSKVFIFHVEIVMKPMAHEFYLLACVLPVLMFCLGVALSDLTVWKPLWKWTWKYVGLLLPLITQMDQTWNPIWTIEFC